MIANFFELIETTTLARPGRATSCPYRAVAAWLAVPALVGGALTALSALPDDPHPGTLAGRAEQGPANTAQSGAGMSPQNLVPGQWTWVSGSNSYDQAGTYGTKGVVAPGNVPGARWSVSWTDSSGSLWLFGGRNSSGYLNDLWQWNIASDQWTWVSGSNQLNQAGSYGTRGVAAPGNVPGARDGAVSWIDANGNFWLFGGGLLNDLWKFDISSGLWTWVSGASGTISYGTYGTKGVAAPGNVPGGREWSVSWADAGGNLWLFGGYGLAASGAFPGSSLNDLWKFNISSGQWTWVSGSSLYDQAGTYGTKGVAAPGNVPGAREGAVSWIDASGNLWLFGGNTSSGYLNDLWQWNIASSQWTWVSGSNQFNQVGTYGSQGVAAPGNGPGARAWSAAWADTRGSLWLFAGNGYVASGSGDLNDLWQWNLSGGQWTWVSGTNQLGQAATYGTQGVAASGNVPGARESAVSWTDTSGNLWLFGGSTSSGYLNDLWVYSNPAASGGAAFHAVSPCRLVDTRAPSTYPISGGRMGSGETRSFAVPSSSCGLPPNALAYSLNATVVPDGPLRYLAMWPSGQTQPLVSTLNSPDGRVKANAAIVPAGTGGAVSVFVTDSTDLILDINGYFVPAGTAGGLAFYPLPPCRVSDTRNAPGANGGPRMQGGETRTISTSGVCNIPSSAQALSLNYTVVPQGPMGYLTTWPAGQAQPWVSTLNAPTGTIVANAAIVPTGTGGQISVYVMNATEVIVDVNGYFAPTGSPGALSFYAATPCRISDTRSAAGPFGGPGMSALETRSIPVPSSSCSIPSTAQAYSLNATVVPSGSLGYLALWPAGIGQPLASTLNAVDGSLTSNAAIVPAGTSGAINAFVQNPAHLILDINGYFAP